VGLAVDDIGTGGSSGRSESPATTEGRNRKYTRRSETDRYALVFFCVAAAGVSM
jgi:hypothetical protein